MSAMKLRFLTWVRGGVRWLKDRVDPEPEREPLPTLAMPTLLSYHYNAQVGGKIYSGFASALIDMPTGGAREIYDELVILANDHCRQTLGMDTASASPLSFQSMAWAVSRGEPEYGAI